MELRRNRSLYSRLSVRASIDNYTVQDTSDYVAHRLQRAGRGERETFAPEALEALHEASGGSLRDVDRLARLVMQ